MKSDFPGSPVVKTPGFLCMGSGFGPWLRNWDPKCYITKKKKKGKWILSNSFLSVVYLSQNWSACLSPISHVMPKFPADSVNLCPGFCCTSQAISQAIIQLADTPNGQQEVLCQIFLLPLSKTWNNCPSLFHLHALFFLSRSALPAGPEREVLVKLHL